MAVNPLYFVPWSSITEAVGIFGSINTGLDTANLLAAVFETNTIQVTGPTTSIEIDDTGGTPGQFTDDFDFSNQTLATAYDGNPVGSGVETLYSYTLSGSDGSTITVYGVAIGGTATDDVLDGFVSTQPLLPGVTYTIVGFQDIADTNYADLVPCFANGSLIDTALGRSSIENLAVGDYVKTMDHGFQPIRWIGFRTVSFKDDKASENLRPIRIRANSISSGLPCEDLIVSPQHRILIRSKIAERMFGTSEVLVAAKHLCCIDGIDVVSKIDEVRYHHILFDHHEIVQANGIASESLFKGPQALKAVGRYAFKEISKLFPEICEPNYSPQSARKVIRGRLGRKLALRHYKNAKPLFNMDHALVA